MTFAILIGLFLGQSDAEVRAMAARVTDYPIKFKLIALGRQAVVPLLEQLKDAKEEVAFETRSTLRWIVRQASERDALADLMAGWVSREPFAIVLLGEVGGDKAVGVLAPLLLDDTRRDLALGSLESIPGKAATRSIGAALKGTPASFKVSLLIALGNRRDREVTPLLAEYVHDEDPGVVRAALEALGRSSDPAAAEILEAAVQKGSPVAYAALISLGESLDAESAASLFSKAYGLAADEERRVAAIRGLGLTCSDATLLLATLNEDSARVREAAAAALLCLAERSSDAQPLLDRVLDRAQDPGTLARALRACSGAADSAAKIARFVWSEDGKVRLAAVAALAEIPGEEATKELIHALEILPPSVKPVCLGVLGRRKDPKAVPAVAALASQGEEELRLEAIRTLGAIGDPSAEDALIDALDRGGGKILDAAYEASLAVAEACAKRGQTAQARTIYLCLLSSRPDLRILNGLTSVADRDSVSFVEPLVEKPFFREQALKCLISIADRLVEVGNSTEAVGIYRRAFELGAIRLEDKLRSLGERVEMIAREGRIDHWWLMGSFPAIDPSSGVVPFTGHKEGDGIRRVKSHRTTDPQAIVTLDLISRGTRFTYAEVVLKADRKAVLKIGSDGDLVCWVNGKNVFLSPEPRDLRVDQDAVPVVLKKGDNMILLKLGGEKRRFSVRIEDDEGRPLRFKIK